MTNYVYAGNQVVTVATNTAIHEIGANEIVKSEVSSGENNFHFTDALGTETSLTRLSENSFTQKI